MLHRNCMLLVEVFPDGESVIVDQENGITHILNDTATIIYNLSDKNEYDVVLNKYVAMFAEVGIDGLTIDDIKEDCKNVLNDMIIKRIVISDGCTSA